VGPAPSSRPAGGGDPAKKPINPLTANRFPEFQQPKIEWLLQRTFGEHGNPSGRNRVCAYCAHFISSAGNAFTNTRFSNRRPITRTCSQCKSCWQPLPATLPATAAELLARAHVATHRGGRRRRKIQINALIKNGFPEITQPRIERLLQRTFREHYDRRPRASAYCVHLVSSAGTAFMHEFRVNFPDALF
jgi:hypothetical protein